MFEFPPHAQAWAQPIKLFSVSESWAGVTLCSYLQCTLTLLWADHWEWRNTLVVPPLDMGTAQQLSIIILQAPWFVHGPSLDHRSSEAKLSQASLSQVKATQHLRIQHNKVHQASHIHMMCDAIVAQGPKRNCEAHARVRQGSARDGPQGERPQSLNPCLELTLKLVVTHHYFFL